TPPVTTGHRQSQASGTTPPVRQVAGRGGRGKTCHTPPSFLVGPLLHPNPEETDHALPRSGTTQGVPGRPGEVWRSKGFAPPEQESTFRTVDNRVDLYALAATLVYLLTGRPPGDPADLPADVPPALADLLRRLLDHEPHQRPASGR